MKSDELPSTASTGAELGAQRGSASNFVEVINELVTANRILFRQGVVDAYGHVSTRHPQIPDAFLIASFHTCRNLSSTTRCRSRGAQPLAQCFALQCCTHCTVASHLSHVWIPLFGGAGL